MKTTQSSQFITSSQAAKILNVSLRTIQLWVENGILRAWKTAGGHRRIVKESVDKLLMEQDAAVKDTDTEDREIDLPNILVVEDQYPILKLYQLYFKEWGLPARLHTASNGYEGLIKAGHYKPCLVICDLLMPNMDGFEMIAALKASPNNNNASVIVVTGLDLQEINRRGSLPDDVLVFRNPPPFDTIKSLVQSKLNELAKAKLN